MNMTLRRLGLGAIGGNLSTLVMPDWHFGASCNDGPATASAALDTFFVTNILVSLLVLMVASAHTIVPLISRVFQVYC